MVILLSGDDHNSKANFLHSRKALYSRENIYEISKTAQDDAKTIIKDIINSRSIFGGKRLLIFSINSSEEVELMAHLKEENFGAVDLLIDLTSLNKNTKIYKQLVKEHKLYEFKLSKDYKVFNIVDLVFINQDKAKAMSLIHQIEKEEDVFLILGAFYTAIRNWISMKNENETWKSLHPFVKQKTTQFKLLNEKNIVEIFKGLVELDHKIKSTSMPPLKLLEDFVLYL